MKFFTVRTVGLGSVHCPYLIIVDVGGNVERCPFQRVHEKGIVQVEVKVP